MKEFELNLCFPSHSDSIAVVNASSANKTRATINQLLDIGIHAICSEFPMGKKMLALPSGGVTLCKTWNLIRLFFFQLIPAMFVDSLLKSKGKSPR